MTAENRRILIIDDERPILMTLEALLGRHGYHPEVAANASTGMRLLQSKSPALVLLDLQLPDAEGLHMLEQIKADHPDTQVIILTAHDSLNNAIESIKRGAYHFISKPSAPEELLAGAQLPVVLKPFGTDALLGAIRSAMSGGCFSAACA